MEHVKYNWGYEQTFTNNSNLGIKYAGRSWYAIKQIDQIKLI